MGELDFLAELQADTLTGCKSAVEALIRSTEVDSIQIPTILSEVHRIQEVWKSGIASMQLDALLGSIRDLTSASQLVGSKLGEHPEPLGHEESVALKCLWRNVLLALVAYLDAVSATLKDSPDHARAVGAEIQVLRSWKRQATEAATEAAATEVKPPLGGREQETLRPQDYLIFSARERYFGIPISRIREIIIPLKTHVLPAPRPDLTGLINLRGEVVPLLSLSHHVGITTNADSKVGYFIVAQEAGQPFAFRVEDTHHLLSISEDQVESAADLWPGGKPGGVFGYYQWEEKQVFLLNTEKWIAP